MSSIVIALLIALSASAWVYSKMYRNSGGIAKTSLIVSIVCGLVVFLISWITLNSVLN